MWGTWQGWLISAFLAAAILGPVAWLTQQSFPSAPTGIALDPANLTELSLPISPDDAWPIFTDNSDAGGAYRSIIVNWNDNAATVCRNFVSTPGDAPPPIQSLVDARHCRGMALFSLSISDLINYNSEHPELDTLNAAGQWASKAGLARVLAHDAGTGAVYLEAAFALGRNLYRERITFDEYEDGIALMSDAAQSMCRVVPPGSVLNARLSDFVDRMNTYEDQRAGPIYQTLSSVDAAVIDASAGDVLAMAFQSKEPMWRVEATLALGRFRFNAGTYGDQAAAARALRRLADDPDAAVAAAATAASQLTVEQYRMIH